MDIYFQIEKASKKKQGYLYVGKWSSPQYEATSLIILLSYLQLLWRIPPGSTFAAFCLELIRILSFCCCSITQSRLTVCDPTDCSTPGLPVLHHLLELTQTHVHQVGDAIQPSHPLSSPSPPAFDLSHHQGLFQ